MSQSTAFTKCDERDKKIRALSLCLGVFCVVFQRDPSGFIESVFAFHSCVNTQIYADTVG